MGGNLFKLGRLPRDAYLAIEAEIRAYLDSRVGSGRVIVSLSADHGVLDMLNIPDEDAEQSFIGHEGPVFALATSADAKGAGV